MPPNFVSVIGKAVAKLKALVRGAAARTYDELWQAAGHVCDLFTEEKCHNFFKAAGYEQAMNPVECSTL